MSTFNLKRFSDPNVLFRVSKENLLKVLDPYREYFGKREYELPLPDEEIDFDYNRLSEILIAPDADTPENLAQDLYLIHECSSERIAEEILKEAGLWGITIIDNGFNTPADIAVQAFLQDKSILENLQMLHVLRNRRSFTYYQSAQDEPLKFKKPSAKTLKRMEEYFNDHYARKQHGRDVRIGVHPDSDLNTCWFIVRHGDAMIRESGIDVDGSSKAILYRPEKFDVIVFNERLGELAINAKTISEQKMYRTAFGLFLFGSEDTFPGEGKYSLEPLRRDGEASLVTADIDGIDWIKLREAKYHWDGADKYVTSHNSRDLFASINERGDGIPKDARIGYAKFEVKFSDSPSTRFLTIKPSNVAIYTKDSDGAVLEKWLFRRGFIVLQEGGADEKAA